VFAATRGIEINKNKIQRGNPSEFCHTAYPGLGPVRTGLC
jgi:hypothetical protein